MIIAFKYILSGSTFLDSFHKTWPVVSEWVYTHQFSMAIKTLELRVIIALTNFMELSPSWEAASCTAAQELPLQCSLSLGQDNPFHTTPSYLSKIQFNIVTSISD
jgi:hypothetical protein